MVQIKVVEYEISYKQVSGRVCLSLSQEWSSEADRLNKSNWEIGEMWVPNISRDKGLFL